MDREHDLKRIPRPSYFLFSEVKTMMIIVWIHSSWTKHLILVLYLERLCRSMEKHEWFFQICKNGMVTKRQRIEAWAELQNAAEQGKKRPFCRAVNRNGLMYAGILSICSRKFLLLIIITLQLGYWESSCAQFSVIYDASPVILYFHWRCNIKLQLTYTCLTNSELNLFLVRYK